MTKMPVIALLALAGCASSQGGMLEQDALQTFQSAKAPGVIAGCVQQSLSGGTTIANDGTSFWVTRPSAWGTVVRFDMKPAADGGSVVEYRSRLKINNGLDKVKACL